MRRLTKRELILIYIATALAFFLAGYRLLFVPAEAEYEAVMAQLKMVQTRERLCRSRILELPVLQEKLKQSVNAYLQYRDRLDPIRDNPELGMTVIAYLEDRHLETKSLMITDIEDINQEEGPSVPEAEEKEDKADTPVKTVSVELTAIGTWDNIIEVLDCFAAHPGVEVQLCTVSGTSADPWEESRLIEMKLSYCMMDCDRDIEEARNILGIGRSGDDKR